MTEIRPSRLWYWIVVAVDDAIKVACDDLGDVVEFLEVVGAVLDEGREGDGGKIADSDFIRCRVLDDLSAEVGRLDSTEIPLIRFGCERARGPSQV
jgi:hypothetical protein